MLRWLHGPARLLPSVRPAEAKAADDMEREFVASMPGARMRAALVQALLVGLEMLRATIDDVPLDGVVEEAGRVGDLRVDTKKMHRAF